MDNSLPIPKECCITFPAKIVLLGFLSILSLSLSLSLSLFPSEDFTPFECSISGQTCFSKMFSSLWRISDGWTPPAVRNLMIMHCSTLTYTLDGLVSILGVRGVEIFLHSFVSRRAAVHSASYKMSTGCFPWGK